MADSGDNNPGPAPAPEPEAGGVPGWSASDIAASHERDDSSAGGHATDPASRAALLNPGIMRLFAGDGGPAAPPPFDLRDFSESSEVFVPIDAAGAPLIERAGERAHELAIQPNGRGVGARPVRGKGGRLMVVERDAPAGPHVARHARTLPDLMPSGVDGLLLRGWAKVSLEIDRDGVAALRRIAEGVSTGVMLAKPGAGQAPRLLAATWWVAKAWAAAAIDEPSSGLRLVPAFTHPDRAGDVAVAPMRGDELFRRAAADGTIDGVVVDPHDRVGEEDVWVGRPVIGPATAARLVQGVDIRPGAAPLPARDADEIAMWLEIHGFPTRRRRLVDAPIPDGPHLVRAVAEDLVAGWSMVETQNGFRDLMNARGESWSPVFVLPPPGAPRPERSAILCPGLLASALSLGRRERPGLRLGVVRVVGAEDRAAALGHAAMARELLALLPPGVDTMPTAACLSASGAGVLRRAPRLATRAWMEERLRAAEADARGLVWFG